jgi:hypothetical protein
VRASMGRSWEGGTDSAARAGAAGLVIDSEGWVSKAAIAPDPNDAFGVFGSIC